MKKMSMQKRRNFNVVVKIGTVQTLNSFLKGPNKRMASKGFKKSEK